MCEENIKWCCLRSKVKRERLAARILFDTLEIDVYCPLVRFRKRTKRGLVWFEEAMFPGYFFARFDVVSQLRAVSYSCGVTGLVNFGDVLAEVPPSVIQELKDQLGDGGVLVIESSWREGDEVEIVEGPFKGLVGLVVDRASGKERVKILIEFLGRSLGVEMDEKKLLGRAKD